MDFAFTEDQEVLRGVARQLLEAEVTQERLQELEAGGEWFDDRTWQLLAEADLLGLTTPTAFGGSGLGLIETCILLEQIGRMVAPLPALSTLVGALAIATFGTYEQQQLLLPPVVSGDAILAIALAEPGADDLAVPTTTCTRDGAGWRVEGTKSFVSAASSARAILVSATGADGPVVALIDPSRDGIELTRQIAATGEPMFDLQISGAPADVVLAAPGIAEWLAHRSMIGSCAIEVGVAARAIEMTAEYSSGRVQFGRPLGSFQAVQQRAADAFIDVLAMRWTMWCAAWRLDEGLPADDDVAVAKFWAAEGGHRVVSAAQHLHGGIGVDLAYPLHRYFYWSKQIEVTLGTRTRQLVRLGRSLAAAASEGSS